MDPNVINQCQIEVTGYFSYLACSQPSVYILAIAATTGIVSAVIALLAMKSNHRGQRINNAMSFLWNILKDEKFLESASILGGLEGNTVDLNRFGLRANYPQLTADEKGKTDSIRILISTWEGVSLAVRHKGYEEVMLKGALRGTCVRHYNIALPFITATRNTEPKCAENWEWLADRWKL